MKTPVVSVEVNSPFRKIKFDSLSSTNTFLKDEYDEFSDFTVVRADVQTGAYGRKGRSWSSPKGGLWFSFILTTTDPFLWIVFTSTAIVDLFPELKIKWPNDVYYGKMKVAGILTERFGDKVVVGVGMNVNNNINEDLVSKATSLSRIYDKTFDLDSLLDKILNRIHRNSKDVEGSFIKWKRNSIILNKNILIKQGNDLYSGRVEDFTRKGELILSVKGKSVKILYGDIIEWEEK